MSRRIVAVVVAALVVIGLAVLIVVVSSAESPPSASEALSRAKEFLDDADSVEYIAHDQVEYFDVADGEQPVEEATIEDSAVFPDRGRSLITYEGLVYETVTVGDDTYSRTAESEDVVGDEQWLSSELLAQEAPFVADFFFTPSGALVSPEQLPELLDTARRPRFLGHRDGSTTIEVRLSFDKFDTVSYFVSPRVEMVIRDDDGRPTAMRLFGKDEFQSQATAIDFEHWNGSVEIEEPTRSELDPTPAFDEDGIAAYDATPLYQPRVIPEDWVLGSATVLVAGETVENCEQVNLSFLDPNDEFSGYLDLYVLPESCSEGRPELVEDFVAGQYTGWFENDEGFLYGEIVVGDTVIQFDTDLTEEELATVLADLVPLDLANPPLPTVAFN